MNSKQRKIAGKIRERAELDGSAQLQRLASERSQFELLKEGTQKALTASANELCKEREQLKKDREELTEAVRTFTKEMIVRKKSFHDQVENAEGVNLVREVLLQLELDEDPMQIALSIRKQFNLYIPEW